MKRILIVAIVALFSVSSYAQQDAEYSFYMFNGLYLNPAYAGSRDAISAMALSRYQWTKIEGAPRSASISLHSPLKNNNVALGLIYTHDRLGVTQSDGLTLDFAYRIPLGKKKTTKLSFGLSGSMTHYRSYLTDASIIDAGDPNFQSNYHAWMPNFGAGVYLYSPKYYVGFSVPHFLNLSLNEKLWNATGNDLTAHQYNHYLLTAGYVFNLGKSVKFKPSFLMKYVRNAPVDFDITAAFLFIDRVWLSVGHRVGDSYIFSGQFYITPQFRVGYAYDLTVSGLSKYAGGTHEVMLGYDFIYDKSRIVNPRYIKYF